MTSTELSIKDVFVNFFKTFQTPDGEYKYRNRIAQMPVHGSRSLVIDFDDLLSFSREVASRLIDDPRTVIEEASAAIREVMQVENKEYAESVDRFIARFKGVPNSVPLRGIRSIHINKLIVVEGIVTRISPVKQQLVEALFVCKNCGEEIRVPQGEEGLVAPTMCPTCSKKKKKPSFKLVPEKSKFVDWQKLVLQERPEELPPGQLPRSIEVVLREDLVDIVRPGDRATIIGILCVQREGSLRKEGAPIFKVFLEANHVEVSSKETYDVEITPEDEKVILELSKDPYIRDKIIASIAPSIHGYEKIKEAIACLLFGGEPKVFPDGVRVRGDIHVLLVGDPGVGKSQILRYVASIAPRGIYTTGKGSTAAGLTAAVVREKRSGDFYLEAGALVLADGGVACIDEFDKMDPRDRVSIHEAMEQQSYHKDFELMLADGSKVRIGDLVDSLMKKYRDKVIIGKETEILPIEGLYVIAYDIINKRTMIVRADRVSRHKAPKKFVKITFSNGRSITVTLEHPIVIWKNGKITTVRADSVKEGMIALGVRYYPVITNSVFSGEFAELSTYCLENLTKLKSSTLLNNLKYSTLHNDDELYTLWNMNKEPRTIVGSYSPEMTLSTMPLELSRLPPSAFRMSNKIKKLLVNELFRKNGFVNEHAVGFTILSREMAEDLQDLLLTLGISSCILKGIRGNKAHYKVVISDVDSLTKFTEIIFNDHRYEEVKKILKWYKERLQYQDVLPYEIAMKLYELLNTLDIDDEYLKEKIKDKSNISRKVAQKYLEKVKRIISEFKVAVNEYNINKLTQIIKLTELSNMLSIPYPLLKHKLFIEKDPKALNVLIIKVKEKLIRLENVVNELNQYVNGNIKFLRITKVDIIGNNDSQWVYDVTVEPYHLFVSHGLILHNTISIAKAGIVATLNARTSILAAANPAFGRYLRYRTIAENIDLPATILSRFDLIFVITDVPNAEEDRKLAAHVVELHSGDFRTVFRSIIPPQLLRKYIAYARKYIHPKLTEEAKNKIIQFYTEMRAKSENPNSPITITPRQLEALIRLAEAHAKMSLSNVVTAKDAEAAIELMMYFLQSVGLDVETETIDIDIVMTGKPMSQREKLIKLIDIMRELEERSKDGLVKISELVEEATSQGLDKEFIERALDHLRREGEIYEPKPGFLKRT